LPAAFLSWRRFKTRRPLRNHITSIRHTILETSS